MVPQLPVSSVSMLAEGSTHAHTHQLLTQRLLINHKNLQIILTIDESLLKHKVARF